MSFSTPRPYELQYKANDHEKDEKNNREQETYNHVVMPELWWIAFPLQVLLMSGLAKHVVQTVASRLERVTIALDAKRHSGQYNLDGASAPCEEVLECGPITLRR